MTLKEEIFGPTRDDVWRQFAKELNGKFREGEYALSARADVKYKNWNISLDSNLWSTVGNPLPIPASTIFRVPFLNKGDLQMIIYRRDVLTSIQKLFGGNDFEIGSQEFDKEFIIKGNDETKIKLLLLNSKITDLLIKCKDVLFKIRDQEGPLGTKLPEGVHELFFKIEDMVTDMDQLKIIFKLFCETLDQLCHIGSAYEDDPNFVLK